MHECMGGVSWQQGQIQEEEATPECLARAMRIYEERPQAVVGAMPKAVAGLMPNATHPLPQRTDPREAARKRASMKRTLKQLSGKPKRAAIELTPPTIKKPYWWKTCAKASLVSDEVYSVSAWLHIVTSQTLVYGQLLWHSHVSVVSDQLLWLSPSRLSCERLVAMA